MGTFITTPILELLLEVAVSYSGFGRSAQFSLILSKFVFLLSATHRRGKTAGQQEIGKRILSMQIKQRHREFKCQIHGPINL